MNLIYSGFFGPSLGRAVLHTIALSPWNPQLTFCLDHCHTTVILPHQNNYVNILPNENIFFSDQEQKYKFEGSTLQNTRRERLLRGITVHRRRIVS
jgi:hypothetical protein